MNEGGLEELTGEMTPDEAARVAEMLGLDVAVACHYLSHNPDLDEFVERVAAYDTTGRRVAVAPIVGSTLMLSLGADGRVAVDAPHRVA
jgi:L-ascorbate metabolism protein UlaG (beta-lactamase superfamily)